MESNSEVLLLLIKNPIKGTAKTRLAKSVGVDKAHAVYLQLLEHTRTITQKLACQKWLYYSKFVEQDEWFDAFYKKRTQVKGDLGDRMKAVFKDAFDAGFEKAVIIGSDCGELTTDIIQEAFQKLNDKDVVIGPAKDGGYYLLGMNAFYPFLFDGMEWSTVRLFDQTIDAIQKENKTFIKLVTLNDVDEYEDWLDWEQKRRNKIQ